MSTVMEPGSRNDASARSSVLDILQKSGNVDEEGRIAEDEGFNEAEEEISSEIEGETVDESVEDESAEESTDDEEESTEDVDGEAVEIDSSTLAQLLGIDESDIVVNDEGLPSFRAKVDGEEKEISFDSLLRNFRLQQHVDNKASSVKQEREAFEQEMTATRDQYKSALEQTAMILGAQENEIMEQYNSVDWEALKSQDPARFGIVREEFRERLYGLQNQRQAIVTEYQKEREKQMQEFNQKRETFMEEQAEKIVEKIPEWKDQAIAKTQSAEMKEYAKSVLGFNDQELAGLVDHRAWVGIRKAMLFDKMSKGADTTAKKVVKLPKVVTRKAPIGAGTKRKVKLAARKEAAVKGDTRDKVGFISDLVNS